MSHLPPPYRSGSFNEIRGWNNKAMLTTAAEACCVRTPFGAMAVNHTATCTGYAGAHTGGFYTGSMCPGTCRGTDPASDFPGRARDEYC